MLTTICCIIVLIVELIFLPKKIKNCKNRKAHLDFTELWTDIVVIICMILLLIEEFIF